MKKILLSTLALSICFCGYAQNRQAVKSISGLKPAPGDKPVPALRVNMTGHEVLPLTQVNPVVSSSPKLSAAQVSIGNATYDLQSNASVGNRILNIGGNVFGTWTISASGDLGAPDRGSGYNYLPSGGSWGSAPAARIEPVRTGWPSIAVTAAGSEHVTSHISGSPLFHAWRTTAGTGTWDTARLASIGPPEVLWGRMAAGGADGNSLHSLSITLPVANVGAIYQGLDGCPIYQRSQDNGVTWDITGAIPPGVDSLGYFGWSADAYAIDARGNTVAFTHGQIDEDWAMWKSVDNGTTWTKTIIYDFPFTRYDDVNNITDIDLDGIADTVLTTDHKVAIIIDNNGMVHCFAGAMYILDEVLADPLSLFLSTDGLLYWNESMGASAPVVIATTPDIDGVPGLTFAVDYVPRYGNGGQTSQPDAAIDASGTMVVSFTTPIENTSSGNPSPTDFSFRNLWMIASTDGGANWSVPVRIGGTDFDEAVFASISRDIVNGCIDVIWQQDGLPGIAVQPPITGNQQSHPFSQNDIIHDCIPVASLVGINEQANTNTEAISISPNPASDFVKFTFTLEKLSSIEMDIYNVNGQKVDHISQENASGTVSITVKTDQYSSGIYSVTSKVGNTTYTNKFVIN